MEAAQLAALGRHLQAVLPELMVAGAGGQQPQPLEAKKLEGGQSNPTFLLHTPSGRRLVLRKKPGIVKVCVCASLAYRPGRGGAGCLETRSDGNGGNPVHPVRML